MKPRFYGPYKVIHKVGEVSYEIELLEGSRVHNVFHVSRLKKAIGQRVFPSAELPPIDEEGKLVLIPEAILDTRERTLRSRLIKEYLVKWKYLPEEDATWESEQVLQQTGLRLLEDKQFQGGRICNDPIFWPSRSPKPKWRIRRN